MTPVIRSYSSRPAGNTIRDLAKSDDPSDIRTGGGRAVEKFVIRLPDGMREHIAVVARTHHRSMNSEIITRLEQSLIQEGVIQSDPAVRLSDPTLSAHERELLQRFRHLSGAQQKALVSLIAAEESESSQEA
ncbi:Arc-like DNA binding dprotein [Pseudomonas duriflava]|uniref:Arc-like DNA binding dprotein n=1 Tax=Pseudomonas duriflava TaxID=459528 RepID=A0A562QAF6_9PSED|nr:Arc family DNA-binding protein [Pseudomonas duriflava]TWI53699.1 Arc-like DNA binding dprotein [Pseudomonas duriflava]